MAWEENSRICLHMQLIAILSRIGVFNGKGEKALGDERLKVLLSKIEKQGLYEELKNLLSRKIDTSPKDPITGEEVSLVH